MKMIQAVVCAQHTGSRARERHCCRMVPAILDPELFVVHRVIGQSEFLYAIHHATKFFLRLTAMP